MKSLFALVVLFGAVGLTSAADQHHRFTWDTLLAASIKHQKNYNYEAITDSYLQVTEEHFEKAAVCSAANALQISDADDCTELHGEIGGMAKTPEKQRKNGPLHRNAAVCKEPSMGDEGLEPPTSTV